MFFKKWKWWQNWLFGVVLYCLIAAVLYSYFDASSSFRDIIIAICLLSGISAIFYFIAEISYKMGEKYLKTDQKKDRCKIENMSIASIMTIFLWTIAFTVLATSILAKKIILIFGLTTILIVLIKEIISRKKPISALEKYEKSLKKSLIKRKIG